MGDYYKRTGVGQISLGFQPANFVMFDIEKSMLSSLRDNLFDGKDIRDIWEHLAKFYETYLICKANDITDDHVKLWLFDFSLIGRAKDWLQCIPNGTIQT